MAGVAVIQGMDARLLLLINNGLAQEYLDQVMAGLSNYGYLLFFPHLAAMLLSVLSERAIPVART